MAKAYIPTCHRCKAAENVLLRYNIISNGARQYFWYCTHCERITPPGIFLTHELIKTWNLGQAFYDKALLKNYSGSKTCAVEGCPNTDTEQHHFAPREFWGSDADCWPTAYICRYHHRLWHDVMGGSKQYTRDPVIQEYKAQAEQAWAEWRNEQ